MPRMRAVSARTDVGGTKLSIATPSCDLTIERINISKAARTFFIPGSSHRSYLSGSRMTGMRSWTVAATAFGVVVRMAQVSIGVPRSSLHRSHSPANANNSLSLTSKQYGCFTVPVRWSSRGPTLRLVPPLRTVRESFQLTRLKFPGTFKS
jgi:hypothetical protein